MTKYLFFDIECANRDSDGRNMIYSFGYLLSDEQFNILCSEKDLVINPNVKEWDWYVLKKILAYPKKYVESQPKFPHFYEKIKKLIEDPDTLVCGFSTKDDVGYLMDECERYGLEPFNFKFFDIQRLEMSQPRERIRQQQSLGETYMIWCNRIPCSLHRSDIDARLTFEVAKAICKKNNQNLLYYRDNFANMSGQARNLKYGFNDEDIVSRTEKRQSRPKRRRENGLRALSSNQEDMILKGSKNDRMFLRQLDFVSQKTIRPPKLQGLKISISLNFEYYNFKKMMFIVQRICDFGGEYVKKASVANIFVKEPLVNNIETRPCSKLKYVQEQIKQGANIEIIEFEELLQRLEITHQELELSQQKNYEYLLDDKYKK